jgi:hypothetical protein
MHPRTLSLAALSTLLTCGVAVAQSTLPSIEVRAGANDSVVVPCAKPESVSRVDVERVLSLGDADMNRTVEKKFAKAVAEACKAGIAHIQVTTDAYGNLTWNRLD